MDSREPETETSPIDMSKAEIGLDFDPRGQAQLKIKCPACGRTTKVVARNAAPGTKVPCSCGQFAAVLKGDDLRKVQKGVDDLKRTFQDLSKKLKLKL